MGWNQSFVSWVQRKLMNVWLPFRIRRKCLQVPYLCNFIVISIRFKCRCILHAPLCDAIIFKAHRWLAIPLYTFPLLCTAGAIVKFVFSNPSIWPLLILCSQTITSCEFGEYDSTSFHLLAFCFKLDQGGSSS